MKRVNKITPIIDVKKYGGRQVAIADGKIIASGKTLEDVISKSRKIDLSKEVLEQDPSKKQKWTEILENLSPEDFGKYKM